MLKTDLEGNLTLESVQRSQSGTYGCRVEDYDAAEDAELSKTLELRVACESPGRAWRRVLAPAASVPSPPQSCLQIYSPCFGPDASLPWVLCPSPLQTPTPGSRRALSKAQT